MPIATEQLLRYAWRTSFTVLGTHTMWFNNILLYHYEFDSKDPLSTLLEEEHLKPCPPHARVMFGWVPPFKDALAHACMGLDLVCFGKEERILPRSVVKREAEERAQLLEAQRGYPVKRAERAQLAEDIEFEFLPKAFCIQKRLLGYLDHQRKWLIINTNSLNQATPLLACLRKSIPSIKLEALTANENLAAQFAKWIIDPSTLPAHIQLGANCILFSPDNEKKRFHCKGYELPAEEVHSLLSQGLLASEITLIWHERIQLTLTHDLTVKQVKCLDYLADDFQEIRRLGEEEQQDAALTLLAGELRTLFDDFIIPLARAESTTSTTTTTTPTLCEA